jgi:hypothetical protein
MPIFLSKSLVSDTWNGHKNVPYLEGQQTRLYHRTNGDDLTLDEFLSIAEGYSVGDTPWAGQFGAARSGYVIDVSTKQENQKVVRETISISTEQWMIDWGSGNCQAVNPKAPGYVNLDIRSTSASGTWWRYGTPAEHSVTHIPWLTAKPTEAAQCQLHLATSLACDLGGLPLTFPLPQEEITVNLSWESATAVNAFRTTWRAARNKRNSVAIWGYDIGTLLFAGVGSRVATSDEMPVTDLRFVYDPYGWCRQSALSEARGKFTSYYLYKGTVPPSGTTCDSVTFTGDVTHAKYPYWQQLFPSLTAFSTLFTSQQLTKVSSLL